jgi:two-component system OmpR family sensor kinase
MVISVVGLAAVALLVVDLAGLALLRSYLLSRVDTQLVVATHRAAREVPDFALDARRGAPAVGPTSWFAVYDGSGQMLLRSAEGADGHPELGSFAAIASHAGGRPFTVAGPTSSWRAIVAALPQGNGYLVSAVSLAEVQATQNQLVMIDLAVTGAVLVLLGLVAASLVRLGLRPVTRMEQTATAIAGGDLHRRVDDADPHTESGRLGTALNAMLGHIQSALAERTASERRLRQFLADASHELRTPLTSIQGFTELYRRGGVPPGPELDEAMGRIESEVGRMRVLVGDLLTLARLDEERPLERRPVDLLEVAADTIRDAHIRVPQRFVALAALGDGQDTFEPVTVYADEARLRQVLVNLVANALQHTPAQAQITVRVGRIPTGRPGSGDGQAPEPPVPDGQASNDQPDAWVGTAASIGAEPAAWVGTAVPAGADVAVVEVSDTGPGLDPADAARVFERLYRADRARGRGGAGLGLAIVAAIVTAHEGRVELWTAPGEGARFRVLLPALPATADPDPDPGPDPEVEPDWSGSSNSELASSFPAVDSKPGRPG